MNNMQEILHLLLELSNTSDFPDASEMHGLICAHACVQPSRDYTRHASEFLLWLGTEGEDQALLQASSAALAAINAQLLDAASDFYPLQPEDSASLELKTSSLADWCGAFVSGMGVHKQLQLNADADEALRDLQQISRASLMAGNAEADLTAADLEELEQAYTELVEYVRVAVQLIHHSIITDQAPALSTDSAPVLH